MRPTASLAVLAVASGGLALVTAAGPAAAVTSHDSAAASNGYRLSIAVGHDSIAEGASDTVSGVLTKAGVPQPGDTIYLRASVNSRRHHAAHRVASGVTGADGSVSFTVTPTTTTRYRLVFRMSATTPSGGSAVGARSKVATVHVLRATTLSARARATRHGEIIQGRLVSGGHGLPGRKVMLQERAVGSDTWTAVSAKRTRRQGVVVFRVAAPSVPEEFQLVFRGGRNFAGSTSGVVTVGS